ncbi:hypothetical protein [Maridesulfovibrio bastinii]|uniref:hypothetical protein n=1 Tax=Maridesulfovibrio bastinii TaxID=47157 RepID=UPI0003FF9B60|nr:hypothetical protein [Maridesulfovibrio bastinii]
MDKSYAESIASDIMNMLESAREQGLDMQSGFQNDAFTSPDFKFGYIFYPREVLLGVPNLPQSIRKKLKKSNIMATVDVEGKKIGIHLICSLPIEFAEIKSAEDILSGINNKGLMDYKEQVASILAEDLNQKTPTESTEQ